MKKKIRCFSFLFLQHGKLVFLAKASHIHGLLCATLVTAWFLLKFAFNYDFYNILYM